MLLMMKEMGIDSAAAAGQLMILPTQRSLALPSCLLPPSHPSTTKLLLTPSYS